jgi:hypothetical protein
MPREYPKLLFICATFICAFVLLRLGYFDWLDQLRGNGDIMTLFVAGFFMSISFTAAFGLAALIELAPFVNPLVAVPVATMGALCADLLLFSFLRVSVEDEIQKLRESRVGRWFHAKLHHESIPSTLREYILLSVAGLVIASPLPDELGVSMLSASHDVQPRKFVIFCYVVNAFGIWIILMAARATL